MLFATLVFSSMVTLPSILLSMISPRISRLANSSKTLAFAYIISSFLPVSSHQVFSFSALTLKPSFIISWIASVISSSPLHEGFILSMACWIILEKM